MIGLKIFTKNKCSLMKYIYKYNYCRFSIGDTFAMIERIENGITINRLINRDFESIYKDVINNGDKYKLYQLQRLYEEITKNKNYLYNRKLALRFNELLEYIKMQERSIDDHEICNRITEDNIYKIYRLSLSKFKNHLNLPKNNLNNNERIIYNYELNVRYYILFTL